ncbi:MAG: CBS domain-containing protein [Nanoarchaeota archaeon]|nr:CBS domain-containing protein [Nanoarchaeota archaeon]
MRYRIRVKDIMNKKPIVVSPEASIGKAARLMARHKIGSVIVVDKGVIVGILTEGDILRRAFIKNKSPTKTRVKDIMTKNPITLSVDDDLSKVANIMNKKGVRRFPVVSEGKLVGYLSEKDLLKIEPSIIDVLLEKLKIREPAFKLTYALRR